ncbi:MAG: hypothetical protein COB45_06400 [Gammaproteobacteria bacterium]|nr:MAG: hypothetical protein COB45_06400 [Gammaproteobacteria bacterium]PHR84627.1 MAG: hypothetical protein COA59_06685 [Colwellia sp.]
MLNTFLNKIDSLMLYKLAFSLFVFSIFVLILSDHWELSSLKLVGLGIEGKEVGYFSSPSWWPNFTIFLPLLTILLGWLLKEIKQTHFKLIQSNMIFDPSTKTIINSVEVINASWNDWLRKALNLWAIIALFVILISYFDCYSSAVKPTYDVDLENMKEIDWSHASLISENIVSKNKNTIFNIIAFTLQGFGASLGILMLVVSGAYGTFINNYSNPTGKWVIIPNKKSDDSRKGFEHFEYVGMLLLFLGLLACLIIYLTILQNTYLSNEALSLSEFLQSLSKETLMTPLHINLSNVLVLMLGIIVILVTLLAVPIGILSYSAKKAKENYSFNFPDECDALNGMKWWPYKWLNSHFIIIAISLAFFSLIFPNIAPYLAILYVGSLVTYVTWKIAQYFKTESI